MRDGLTHRVMRGLQAADDKLTKARSRLDERERQSAAAQAAVTAAWDRAHR